MEVESTEVEFGEALRWFAELPKSEGQRYLAWAEAIEHTPFAYEKLDDMRNLYPDNELKECLNDATCSRISRKLLTPDGLDTFRILVVAVSIYEDHSGLDEALDVVLQVIRFQIGDDTKKRLNSWKYVGKAVYGFLRL